MLLLTSRTQIVALTTPRRNALLFKISRNGGIPPHEACNLNKLLAPITPFTLTSDLSKRMRFD